MGVGHIAVGLASKRWARNTSLGWLVLAPIFVDLLFSVFCLLGIERAKIVPGITKSIPLDLEYIGVSHSLVAVLGWALFGSRAAVPLLLLAAFLFAINAGAYFGPPPPDITAMVVGNLLLVFVVLAFAAINRRRSAPAPLSA